MAVTGYDVAFSDAMRQRIRLQLQGDDTRQGLYRQIMSCPDYQTYCRIRGEILAYENVLTLMNDVARAMNDGEEPVRPYKSHLGMN